MEGKIRTDCKKVNATTIFRTGLRTEISSYRRVSLTIQVCKVIEKNRKHETIKTQKNDDVDELVYVKFKIVSPKDNPG